MSKITNKKIINPKAKYRLRKYIINNLIETCSIHVEEMDHKRYKWVEGDYNV